MVHRAFIIAPMRCAGAQNNHSARKCSALGEPLAGCAPWPEGLPADHAANSGYSPAVHGRLLV
jgi:hypothetical protein